MLLSLSCFHTITSLIGIPLENDDLDHVDHMQTIAQFSGPQLANPLGWNRLLMSTKCITFLIPSQTNSEMEGKIIRKESIPRYWSSFNSYSNYLQPPSSSASQTCWDVFNTMRALFMNTQARFNLRHLAKNSLLKNQKLKKVPSLRAWYYKSCGVSSRFWCSVLFQQFVGKWWHILWLL